MVEGHGTKGQIVKQNILLLSDVSVTIYRDVNLDYKIDTLPEFQLRLFFCPMQFFTAAILLASGFGFTNFCL